jgi:prophage antirepressor-like protein
MELINQLDETLSFNTQTVRLIGTYVEPWFVAKDICDILTIKDVSKALTKLPEEWKGTKVIRTLGGNQNMRIINESAVYKLIMRSNKEIADTFQRWVCGDVLPSLRKKGEYKMNDEYLLKLEEMKKVIEDKDKELDNTKKDLKEKTLRVKYTENILNETKEVLTTKSIELNKIKKNHHSILKKRSYHKFKVGKCFYIWMYPECEQKKFKVGMSSDINDRLKTYRVSNPELKLVYLVYLNENSFLEDAILLRLDKYRVEKNHELIRLSGGTIIESARFILEYFKIEHTEEEELHLYNKMIYTNIEGDKKYDGNENIPEEERPKLVFMDEEGNELTFRTCPKCEKHLSLENFSKNPDRKNNVDVYCKDCCKIKYVNAKLKDKKDKEMKECTKCLKVIEKSEFNNRIGSSDGLSSECKKCALEMYYKRAENREYIEAPEVKCCLKCKENKPLTEFGKKKDSVDGYNPNCKPCWSIIANSESKKKVPAPSHKTCNKCGINKAINEFWKRASYKDGYLNTCGKCCNANR